MNVDLALNRDRVILRTGYDHIDEPHEAQSAGMRSLVSYKPLADPVGVKLQSSQRATMLPPGTRSQAETDFFTVAMAYWVDGYVRRAVDEYVNLVLKSGFLLKGKNQAAVDYLKIRLRTLKVSSGRSFEQIISMMSYCTVLFGNAFLIKVPFKGTTPVPGLKLSPGPGMKPIGGYFWTHPAMMQPVVDIQGNVTIWYYIVNGTIRGEFKPEEVVHIAYNRPPNVLFGQPFFMPVLEDVRTLRQLEYQTIMLVNRYLHPIIHVRKGISKDGKIAGRVDPQDILDLEDLIRNMSADGTLVTAYDVQMEVHGMKGEALDIGPILDYWKGRVFGGLGVSSFIMGEGSAGVGTADSLTAEMHDMAQAFQRTIAQVINEELIFPMLIEGGFDPITNEDECHFEFNTIAVDEDIKRRNQTIQEWFSGEMTHDEFRRRMGDEPLAESDYAKTYFGFTAQFGNDPAADQNPAKGAVDNKQRPAGQAGKKMSPKGDVVTPATKKP